MEFSHWIPDRYLANAERVLGGSAGRWVRRSFGRSLFNGNYVSSWRHFLHDPYRQILGARAFVRLPFLLRMLDRFPRRLAGALFGSSGICRSAMANSE